MGRKAIPREKVEAICADYLAFEKVVAIAAAHDVSLTTIWKILKREGLAPRGRGHLGQSGNSQYALGCAAKRAGMTVQDIEAWARSQGGDAFA